MSIKLNGVFVPTVTPFHTITQEIEYSMLQRNIELLNKSEVTGYMALGSNGEFFMLTDEESCNVIRTIKEAISSDKLLLAGTGRESTKLTIELTKQLEQAGADAVFVLTPHYFPKQITQDVLIQYYSEVAEKSPLPIVLYNAPGYAAGVNIDPETVAVLSGHENIIGMKNTTTIAMENYTSLISPYADFSILAGTLGQFLHSLQTGAVGGVLSAANFIPELCCQIYKDYSNGNLGQAEHIHHLLVALAKITTSPFGVSGVKMAMNALGYEGGSVRGPLQMPGKDAVAEFNERLRVNIEQIRGEECYHEENENCNWV